MLRPKLKYGLLACTALAYAMAFTAPANADVTIERDKYGVPKITADTDAEMWFAFGFAQARDRLIQLEIFRQAARGALPVLNDIDNTTRKVRNWKRQHKFPKLQENMEKQFDELKKVDDTRRTAIALTCFATGIEVFKVYVTTGKTNTSEQCNISAKTIEKVSRTERADDFSSEEGFIEQKTRTQKITQDPWDAEDILALFHFRVMDEFSLRSSEMKNLQLLYDLTNTHKNVKKGIHLFNSMKWALDGKATTTIPADERQKDIAQKQADEYHSKLTITAKSRDNPLTINGCKIYNPDNLGGLVNQTTTLTAHNTDAPFPIHASNWWVIAQKNAADKDTGAPDSLLFNGPQITALDPNSTYQVTLKSKEGFKFSGNAYVGSPNFWQGHNGTMAFGLTAGNIDVSDVFCVDVTKKGDKNWSYGSGDNLQVFKGILEGEALVEFQQQASNSEKFFKGTLTNMYTVGTTGWPVLAVDVNPEDEDTGTAYILRYNWQGLTADTLHHWLRATQSTSFKDWNKNLDRVSGNFNLSAIQKDGTAGYRLTGSLPVKKGMKIEGNDAQEWNYYPGYDPRLPVAMTPEEAWPGDVNNPVVKNYHKLGQTIDNGIITNWNQKPFINMPDTDLDYDSYFRFDRVSILREQLRRTEIGDWTLDDILELNGELQRIDVNFVTYMPFLEILSTHKDLNSRRKKTIDEILRWTGNRGAYKGGDHRGLHYGHVLFYHWLEAMNTDFTNIISNGTERFSKGLKASQMKLKQPKLSLDVIGGKKALTVDVSQNMSQGSRVILNALHSVFTTNSAEPRYSYDTNQYDFFAVDDPDAGTEQKREMAFKMMAAALDAAMDELEKIRDKGYVAENMGTSKAYLAPNTATFNGISRTLAANDTQIGFRPGEDLNIRHFRNRGSLNIGVAFKGNQTEGKNLTIPGVREYRDAAGAGRDGLNGDWSSNQLDLFINNEYRKMHILD